MEYEDCNWFGYPLWCRWRTFGFQKSSAKFRSPGAEDAADTLIQEGEQGLGSRSAARAYFSGMSELPHQRADWLAAFCRLKTDRSFPNGWIETSLWLYSRVLLWEKDITADTVAPVYNSHERDNFVSLQTSVVLSVIMCLTVTN